MNNVFVFLGFDFNYNYYDMIIFDQSWFGYKIIVDGWVV